MEGIKQNNTLADGSAPPLQLQAALAPMLESMVPGLSLISNLGSTYFNIDITQYLISVLVILAIATGLKHGISSLWDFVSEYTFSRAEVRFDDEMYNYLMFWVSKQNFSRSTPHFVAGTQTNSSAVWSNDDSEDNTGNLDSEELESLEDQPKSWDKIKDLYYTPAVGRHLFWYKSRLLLFERRQEESQGFWSRGKQETVCLSCMGRNPAILKDLLYDAQITYHERDGNRTVIYRGSKPIGGGSEDMEWIRCLSRPPRPMATVVLDEAQKDSIVSDMKEYLHPYTRRWYSNRGIPYRRGYLFHGPPGTGKTSLCFALAGLLSLRIYVVSLNSRSLTEDSLANLFRELPWRCIVLLEDIDSAGITAKREGVKEEEPSTSEKDPKLPPGGGENSTNPKGITLSAFLNIIDGVASSEGRILVMTTNHIEKLDPAILRPGRVDLTICFGFADSAMIRGIYQAIFCNQELSSEAQKHDKNGKTANGHIRTQSTARTLSNGTTTDSPPPYVEKDKHFQYHRHHKTDAEIEAMAIVFAERMPSGEFTPAELQGYLLKHKSSPDAALEGVEEFVRTTKEEKEARKKGTPAK